MNSLLADEIEFINGYGMRIEWFIRADNRSAVGIVSSGEPEELWAIDVDDNGQVHTQSAKLGEWQTGYEV